MPEVQPVPLHTRILPGAPLKAKKAKPPRPDSEVLVRQAKDRVQLTATVPGKQYLIVAAGAEEPSLSGKKVEVRHGARIYELRLVSESFAEDHYGLCRGKGACVPVIPPPPSLTAVSAWVWWPKK